MAKPIKFPSALISGDCRDTSLTLDGGSIIDQCIATAGSSGTFFLEQHLLYAVLGGEVRLAHGDQHWCVHRNEMILLRKAQRIDYVKQGDPTTGRFESLLFGINDTLLKNFLTSQQVSLPRTDEEQDARVCPMSDRLVAYCHSLDPYFNNPAQTNPGLLKLKIMELLYCVMECSTTIFRQMLQLRQPARTDLHSIVEANLTEPISIEDLAYLSGRSLSSFKREFQQVYGMPPAQWIRTQRLEKARQMLQGTAMPVSDVAYSLGFENPSHFSRLFKQHFGISPSAC